MSSHASRGYFEASQKSRFLQVIRQDIGKDVSRLSCRRGRAFGHFEIHVGELFLWKLVLPFVIDISSSRCVDVLLSRQNGNFK